MSRTPSEARRLDAELGARTRGLVDEERVEGDARVRVYRLRREPFEALQAWPRELEGFWSAQLESFAAHVGGRAGEGNPKPEERRPRP